MNEQKSCLHPRWLLAAAFLTLGAGCSLRGADHPQTVYDLGPLPAGVDAAPRAPLSVMVPAIVSPESLDSTGIVYRLLYAGATRPQTYAMSRWSAPPAQLIGERVRNRFAHATSGVLAADDSARADYTLKIELEDFSQAFDAAGKSRVVLRARTTLSSPATRALLAQRNFSLEGPAGDNAESAVKALAELTDTFAAGVLEWTLQTAKAQPAGAAPALRRKP
jgi:cholesterol transport system auxiliary component